MSTLVYVKDPKDEKLVAQVYQTLRDLQEEGVFGIGRIYTAEEADREEGLKGDFTFVIESDGYTSFGDRAVRPLVQNFDASDYRFGRATHGYMPDYGPSPCSWPRAGHPRGCGARPRPRDRRGTDVRQDHRPDPAAGRRQAHRRDPEVIQAAASPARSAACV